MKRWIAFWNILVKDMKTYYLKPPNISWGLIFPQYENWKRRLSMKPTKAINYLLVSLLFFTASVAYAGFEYKVIKEHPGGNVTPVEAFSMVQKDPRHTFLVDIRTRAEYQFVGHIEGAINIPFMFLSTEIGKKGYKLVSNPNFIKDLLDRFNPETDTLIFY